MKCGKCGAEFSDDLKVCPECGDEVSIFEKISDKAEDFVENTTENVEEFFDDAEEELVSAVQEVRDTISGKPTGGRLKDDRGLVSYILLSIITLGIYSYYFIYTLARDINIACKEDGEKTAGLVKFIILSIVTCGIYAWIWYYKLGNRLAENAPRYGLSFQENGTTVLLWLLFGMLLCGIGPFIAMHILIKNSNKIFAAYNKANNL